MGLKMISARGKVTARIPETDEGLQGRELAQKYDDMQRHLRDQGWLQEKVDDILAAEINHGTALEVGCGPGYLGLEWMAQTATSTQLVGLDISKFMLERARLNAANYGVADRCRYDFGNALDLPYRSRTFDHAVSASSLHEWSDPVAVLSEIRRVLRPGGRYCISDLRRDIDRTTLQFMKANIAADMRPGFRTSIKSAYLHTEVLEILRHSGLADATVREVQMGIVISGRKEST